MLIEIVVLGWLAAATGASNGAAGAAAGDATGAATGAAVPIDSALPNELEM